LAQSKIDLATIPQYVRDYLFYMETIKGRSALTVREYYLDIRLFLRFMAQHFDLVDAAVPLSEIDVSDFPLDAVKKITMSDVLEFFHYIYTERGNQARTRARKIVSIRVFFKYLHTNVHLIDDNPMKNLDLPSAKKSLPRYLSLEDSMNLLGSVEENKFSERDYCILTLFLNCGMRLSELVGINLTDIQNDTLRLLGKGNKERMVYLNEACQQAIAAYIKVRPQASKEPRALFISNEGRRISRRRVQQIVEESLKKIGLDGQGYSTHKLRHTAATLMYQQGGVDVRVLQEILGHVSLSTTEIYTHISDDQRKQAAQKNPLAHVSQKKLTKKQSDDR